MTTDDLADACLTEFRGITCLSCKARLHALVCDVSHPILAREVTRKPPEDAWRQGCPVCHERIALPIVEFVE